MDETQVNLETAEAKPEATHHETLNWTDDDRQAAYIFAETLKGTWNR